MERVCVFAHYDIKNIVDDYVVYYVKALKKFSDKLIFVSACELSEEEKSKLSEITDYIIAEKHNEYDFGSYKRGYLYAKNKGYLDDTNELLFVNDSCYGPFKPLENIFAFMEDSKADFWGLSKNKYGFRRAFKYYFSQQRPHIQSYFIAFRSKVITSKVFDDFMNSIKAEKSKQAVISKYEIGMSEKLIRAGFKDDFYLKDYYKYNNPVIYRWRTILTHTNFPLVKCSLLRLKNTFHTTIVGWREVLSLYYYPKDLIDKNLEYTGREKPLQENAPADLKLAVFNTISEFNPVIRQIFAVIIEKFFPYIKD